MNNLYTRERLIKVYFRHNRVRVVLKNLLTYSMLTNFLRAPLPCSDENILLIRRSLTELPQEPQVIVQVMAQVIDAVAEHG